MAQHSAASDNIVDRLKTKLNEARALGFQIRMELLNDEQASWCVIAGTPTLFVDQSQTAAEQLRQLDEILAAYRAQSAERSCSRVA